MRGSLASKGFQPGESIFVCHAVVPDAGEDSFAFDTKAQGGYLCVADGCGGLGSRRYGNLGDRTGAYLAANLVTREVAQQAGGLFPLPDQQEAGRALCQELTQTLSSRLARFEADFSTVPRVRIVGSMQRVLPTTLCLLLTQSQPPQLDCLFVWAGDSRGYVLDTGGLHQLTSDHTALAGDAMESLYKDTPLSNMLHGEGAFYLSGRRARLVKPCVTLVATDGVYSSLQNPMEMEWLLLSTLHKAKDMAHWQRRLCGEIKKVASDDCTLGLAVYGYLSFEALQKSLAARRTALQREYITPVRRHKADLDYARGKWQEYMKQYDWTERAAQGEPDWRI